MYRETSARGLGVHNVKCRSMAMLIHTFLAQAIYPRFTSNMFCNTLYRWHVLEERNLPGCPPFYSTTFFSTIRDVHENTPLNVTWITVKQWYTILLEKGVTLSSDDPSAPAVLITWGEPTWGLHVHFLYVSKEIWPGSWEEDIGASMGLS